MKSFFLRAFSILFKFAIKSFDLVLYYRGKSAGGPAFLALAAPVPFPFGCTSTPAFISAFFCLAASLFKSFFDNLTSPSAPTAPPPCLAAAFLAAAF
jgi:hypothetical protein